MGLADWFGGLGSNVQIDDVGTISRRYRDITRRLNTDFWNTTSDTSHSLYVGSYGRNTAIKGFSDLDMIFELPPALYSRYNSHIGNGQSALLQAVRNSIGKTYTGTRIGADGQVVAVSFLDGITFEVVPISGLLVDTLAYQFMASWTYRTKSRFYYDWMCRDFFAFMKDHPRNQAYWKAPGSGQYVYGKGLFQWKATRCYNIAVEAIGHESAEPEPQRR